jgi:hypothetical protein
MMLVPFAGFYRDRIGGKTAATSKIAAILVPEVNHRPARNEDFRKTASGGQQNLQSWMPGYCGW